MNLLCRKIQIDQIQSERQYISSMNSHFNPPSQTLLEKIPYVKMNFPQLLPSKAKNIIFKCLEFNVSYTPESKFIIVWNILNVLILNIYFIEIPITIGFQNHRKEEANRNIFQMFNLFSIGILLIGIIINLKTAFYKTGILISSSIQVRRNYLKSQFWIDSLAILIIIIQQLIFLSNTQGPGIYRWIFIIFFIKVGSLSTMEQNLLTYFDLNRRIKAFIRLYIVMTRIFTVCNFCACNFFLLSDSLQDYWPQCVNCTWLQKITFNSIPLNQYNQFGIQYTYSLYWASSTMITIGYGDITPQNPYQITYTILVQFFACILYAYAFNSIYNIVQQFNSKKQKIYSRLNIINVYMRDKRISQSLNGKINAFLNHYYLSRNLRQKSVEVQIIDELTPELRRQLYFQAYSNIFLTSIFNNFQKSILQQATTYVTEVGYFQNQIICCQSDQEYSLFHVMKNTLKHQICNHAPTLTVQTPVSVGVFQFITQSPYLATMSTTNYSLIYKLLFKDFKISLIGTKDFQKFFEVRHLLLIDKQFHLLEKRCYFCQSFQHRMEQCFDFTLRKYLLTHRKESKQQNEREPSIRRQNKTKKIHQQNVLEMLIPNQFIRIMLKVQFESIKFYKEYFQFYNLDNRKIQDFSFF